MLGALSTIEIEKLLTEQVLGRIAMHADDTTYIVPINYIYQKGCIYAHSSAGMKIEMMRKNPNVCFETDEIKDLLNWKSVIAWGGFEEIMDIHEKQQVMQRFINRIMPLIGNDSHPSHGITENDYDIGNGVDLIVYRLRLTKKTGRYESS